MHCMACGAPVKDGASFCGKCGARQEAPAAGAPTAESTVEMPAVTAPIYAPPPTYSSPPTYAPTAVSYAPPPAAVVGSGGRRGVIIALIAVSVLTGLVVVGAGGFLAYRAYVARSGAGQALPASDSSDGTAGTGLESTGGSDAAAGDGESAGDDGTAGAEGGSGTSGEDQSAVAGDIFLRATQLDQDISAAANKVNAAIGKKRPSTPVLESELQELVRRADALDEEARACTDSRAVMLTEACGCHVKRANALAAGYLAWFEGRSYTSFFQSGHEAKYRGLGYDEATGELLRDGLQSRINQAFAN